MNLPLRQKSFLNLFPTPEFLLLSTAGIAVTDTDTKFIQLRREMWGNGFTLLHSKKIDNPPGAIESGLVNNKEGIIAVLKDFSSQYHIQYAHATLPEEKAYIFTTKIGWVPPEGQRDAVAFILEGNAPVALAESLFDFEIISADESAGEIKLTVCVLPENVVNTYTEVFESAGITPISFDIESQAIARAVIGRGDRRPHLVINAYAKKTGFYVVEDEVVQFSTTIAYGMGEDGSYQNINDLKTEMRKVITFWSFRIEKIILCGPGGNSTEFISKLMSGNDVPYELADVWLNMSSPHDRVLEISLEESLEYASVMGLALPHDR